MLPDLLPVFPARAANTLLFYPPQIQHTLGLSTTDPTYVRRTTYTGLAPQILLTRPKIQALAQISRPQRAGLFLGAGMPVLVISLIVFLLSSSGCNFFSPSKPEQTVMTQQNTTTAEIKNQSRQTVVSPEISLVSGQMSKLESIIAAYQKKIKSCAPYDKNAAMNQLVATFAKYKIPFTLKEFPAESPTLQLVDGPTEASPSDPYPNPDSVIDSVGSPPPVEQLPSPPTTGDDFVGGAPVEQSSSPLHSTGDDFAGGAPVEQSSSPHSTTADDFVGGAPVEATPAAPHPNPEPIGDPVVAPASEQLPSPSPSAMEEPVASAPNPGDEERIAKAKKTIKAYEEWHSQSYPETILDGDALQEARDVLNAEKAQKFQEQELNKAMDAGPRKTAVESTGKSSTTYSQYREAQLAGTEDEFFRSTYDINDPRFPEFRARIESSMHFSVQAQATNSLITQSKVVEGLQGKVEVEKARIRELSVELEASGIKVQADGTLSPPHEGEGPTLQEMRRNYQSTHERLQTIEHGVSHSSGTRTLNLTDEQIKFETIQRSPGLSAEEVSFHSSQTRITVDGVEVKVQTLEQSLPREQLSGKAGPPREMTKAYKGVNNAHTSEVSTSSTHLKEAGAGVGAAIAIGAIAGYGSADPNASGGSKLQEAGVGGANGLVESPALAVEGVNGIHSAAEDLCSGNFTALMEKCAAMTIGLITGLFSLQASALTMVCDGAKAFADSTHTQFLGQGLAGGACFAKDASKWINSNIVGNLAKAATTVTGVVAPVLNEVIHNSPAGGLIHMATGLFLVDPNSRVVVGTVSDQDSEQPMFNLLGQSGNYYCKEDPNKVAHPLCYRQNPFTTPQYLLQQVELHP